MAYSKVNWTNQIPINTTNLAKMDQGIADAHTGSVILEELKKVDGSGSGLDADFLDGRDSSVFFHRGDYLGTTGNMDWLAVPGCYNVQDSVPNRPPGEGWGSVYVSFISHDRWVQQLWVGQFGKIFVRYSTDANGNRAWQPWKEVGGGVKSVQRGVVKAADQATTIDIPISTIDTSKSMVVIDGAWSQGPGNADYSLYGLPYVHTLTANNLRLDMSGVVTGTPVYFSWQVIEYA